MKNEVTRLNSASMSHVLWSEFALQNLQGNLMVIIRGGPFWEGALPLKMVLVSLQKRLKRAPWPFMLWDDIAKKMPSMRQSLFFF